MRIAFISQPWDAVYPPVEMDSIKIWTYRTASLLAPDHGVTIYSKRARGDRSGTQQHNGIRYRRFDVEWDRRFAGALRRLPRTGIVVYPWFWSSLYYRGYARKVAEDLRQNPVDVVHIQNFASFAPIIRAALPDATIAVHTHCEWLSQLDRRATARYLDSADLAIGCSDHVIERAKRLFPDKRFATVYNGVDLDRFQTAGDEPDGDAEDGGEILFVGRLSPEKGIHTLCAAFDLLADRHPAARLTIVGPPGPGLREFVIDISDDPDVRALARFYPRVHVGDTYRDECLDLVRPAHRGRVSFTGSLPQAELPQLYRRAAVVANPSLSEAFGFSLVEAMACARPVVATAVGGMKEIVADGTTGLLVPADDAEALAGALDRLLASPDERRTMGAAGLDRARQLFDWDRVTGDLLAAYHAVRSADRPPAGR